MPSWSGDHASDRGVGFLVAELLKERFLGFVVHKPEHWSAYVHCRNGDNTGFMDVDAQFSAPSTFFGWESVLKMIGKIHSGTGESHMQTDTSNIEKPFV